VPSVPGLWLAFGRHRILSPGDPPPMVVEESFN